MVNKALLLDRFGETDFLHELWTKACKELPGRLIALEPVLQQVQEGADGEALAKMLHKLRGLVSNFLTEEKALSALVACEKCVHDNDPIGMMDFWKEFRVHLDSEVEHMDRWLAAEGFPKI